MHRILIFFLALSFIYSCHNGKNIPNVSNIKVELELQRFDHDFFNIDTMDVPHGINSLKYKYPLFLNDFIGQILGFTLQTPPDTLNKYIRFFIKDYKFVKDSANQLYLNFEPQMAEIKKGLQFVKYYFPKYKLPKKIITFIGPFDGYSDILSADALAIGLQLHMGSNFTFYKSDIAHDLFPEYITSRFTKEYIPVNAIKNIIDDLYPDKNNGKALIEQMVDKGKRLYMLDKFMPYTADYLKIGYSEKQLKECYNNESLIWDFFLRNELLNTTDQNITKNYIGEGPKTQELGNDSPGNIAAFSGWRIVNRYMEKYPDTGLAALMEMDGREIYNKAKYKPKG